jgi:hypothetical protein
LRIGPPNVTQCACVCHTHTHTHTHTHIRHGPLLFEEGLSLKFEDFFLFDTPTVVEQWRRSHGHIHTPRCPPSHFWCRPPQSCPRAWRIAWSPPHPLRGPGRRLFRRKPSSQQGCSQMLLLSPPAPECGLRVWGLGV